MILKSAVNKDTFRRRLHFTSSARVAFEHLLNTLKIECPGVLMIPAYIGFTDREGSGVFDPIENSNTPFEFYTLNDNLGFDLRQIEKRFLEGNVKAFLVIYYFGFCAVDIDALASLCKKHGVLLIEDCAHAFQLASQKEHLGNKGDFAFYSLHKYLSTTSGGILRINNADYEVAEIEDKSAISPEVLKQYIETDLVAIAEKRIENYNLYDNLLENQPGIDLMFQRLNGEIPQSFPIKVQNDLREKLYFYLMDKDMPTTALYYRLIDNLTQEKYPVSHRISKSILNLPLHQDTTTEDIERLVSSISEYLKMKAND